MSDMRARLQWAVGISISAIASSLLHGRTQLKYRYDDEDNAKNEQIVPSALIKNALVIIR